MENKGAKELQYYTKKFRQNLPKLKVPEKYGKVS